MKILIFTISFFQLFLFKAYAQDCWLDLQDKVPQNLKTEVLQLIESDIEKAQIKTFFLIMGSSKGKLLDIRFGEKNTDTLFDLASITKVFNAMVLMKLLDEKNISIQTKLSTFFSEFSTNQKKHITIEDLLRHRSGFKAGVGKNVWSDTIEKSWKNILELNPTLPYAQFKYSDINFLYVGKLIEQLSQRPLNVVFDNIIVDQLNFNNTMFMPQGDNCYPTQLNNKYRCSVHDPTSYKLSGLTGHAGIFSNAEDMTKLARIFLGNGSICNKDYFPKSILHSMTNKVAYSDRGLGVDISSVFARRPRGEFFTQNKSYGHTGFTGISIWIDPVLDSFVLVLSNATFSSNERESKRIYLDLLLKLSNKLGQFRVDHKVD